MDNFIGDFISKSLIDYELIEKWNYKFCASNLPICPRQLMLGRFYEKTKHERLVPFTQKYSFHVGQAIHSLVQDTWSRQSILWGDWKCLDKDCGVKYSNTQLPEGKCIRCGHSARYIEKEVEDMATGFTGRCDAVVFCEELDGYLVYELKSRNINIINNVIDPYLSDIYQVSHYATLLSRKYWLRIVGRVILWLGKPKPKPYKYWYYPGIGEELVDEQFKLKLDMDKKVSEGRVLEVTGRCNTFEDTNGCLFAGICLSPSRDRLVEEEYQGWLRCQK